MRKIKYIKGNSEDEIWQQVTEDLTKNGEVLEYNVVLELKSITIILQIDIDPGGGFESGYESTILNAPIQNTDGFRFAIHHEKYLDEIGKFFGMEDIETGYPEFDKKVIIKSNDATRVKKIFSDSILRQEVALLTDYTLHINRHREGKEKQPYLELEISKGITDPAELRKVYHAFFILTEMINGKKEE